MEKFLKFIQILGLSSLVFVSACHKQAPTEQSVEKQQVESQESADPKQRTQASDPVIEIPVTVEEPEANNKKYPKVSHRSYEQ